MTIKQNRFTIIVLVALLLMPIASTAGENLSDRELVDTLRQGGTNIYFRHEATDWSQQDFVRERDDWLSCDGSEIRQLSAEGRTRAARSGAAMRKLCIPVSEVLASPYCRTMETGRLLGFGAARASSDVMNLRVAEYFGGQEAIIITAQKLLARPPAPGTNRVIVAHGNVAQAATPVYPGEGEAVVFRPDGAGGFTVVDRIPPERWTRLVRME